MQLYRVQTRLLGWDHRWFYLEHSFLNQSDRCVAIGVTRAGLRSEGRWVPADDVANRVHPGALSPAIPRHVHDWISVEDAMFRHGQRERELRRRDPGYRAAG